MNPETGTFISMDSYQGSIYDPVSLHKYLYANSNPVKYSDPSGYFSFAETSIGQTINGILENSRIFNVLKGLEFVDKATVFCNVLNIGVQVKNIIGAILSNDIVTVFKSFIGIGISCATIAAIVFKYDFLVTMIISCGGLVNDISGVVSAILEGNWWDLVYNIGFLVIDVISMGMSIDAHDFEIALKQSKILRSSDQKSLIDLTKDTKFKEELTEGVKDILFDWAKEYDSFEDVWNIIYHF